MRTQSTALTIVQPEVINVNVETVSDRAPLLTQAEVVQVREQAVRAEGKAHGAWRAYAVTMNTYFAQHYPKANTAWYEAERTTPHGKLAYTMQRELADSLRKKGFANPANYTKRLRDYAKEEMQKAQVQAQLDSGAISKSQAADMLKAGNGAKANEPRDIKRRFVEEGTKLYKAWLADDSKSADVVAHAADKLAAFLVALKVDVDALQREADAK